jgi:hypothetical protein
MIAGIHAMFYSAEAGRLRKFLRDKLGLKATDIGGGWLIFGGLSAEIGCHPANALKGAPSGTMDISFYCDDIRDTVSALEKKGVEFKGKIEDHGYGLVTYMKVPGDFHVQLFQPKYKVKKKMVAKKKAVAKKKRSVEKAAKRSATS